MHVHKMTDVERRMTDDFDWAQHAPAVQEDPAHYGKLVVVHDRRILAVGRDRQAMLQQAAKEAGVPTRHLVVVLVPRPGDWEIPH